MQVKIVDLETQSYANSPRPASQKRLEAKVTELQHRLDSELGDKNEALRQKTAWERQSRDYQTQLKEMAYQQERLVKERGAYEQAIGELQNSLKKAVCPDIPHFVKKNSGANSILYGQIDAR
jgi:myosin protein heavy chain